MAEPIRLTPEQELRLLIVKERMQQQPTESIKQELCGLMRMMAIRQNAVQGELKTKWGVCSPPSD